MNVISQQELKGLQAGDILDVPIAYEGCLLFADDPECSTSTFISKWLYLGEVNLKLSGGYEYICFLISGPDNLDCTFREYPDDYFDEEKNEVKRMMSNLSQEDIAKIDFSKSRRFSSRRFSGVKKKVLKPLGPDGVVCCECKNFFDMAVPNLSDGRMACWSCRDSCSWKYNSLYMRSS